MNKLLLLAAILLANSITAQTIYKNNKFFGGSFYINTHALKDIIIDGNSVNIYGSEYWNNSPRIDSLSKDIDIRAKLRSNITYGYFPLDNLAIGGRVNISSNSFNQNMRGNAFNQIDTLRLYTLSNKSFDFYLGPFIRYYFEIGAQPYEVGAVFIEGTYSFGLGSSKDNIELEINDTTNISLNDSYKYGLSVFVFIIGSSLQRLSISFLKCLSKP